jgi:hypothetical protein
MYRHLLIPLDDATLALASLVRAAIAPAATADSMEDERT